LDDADKQVHALIDPIHRPATFVATMTHSLLPGALQHHAGRRIIPSTTRCQRSGRVTPQTDRGHQVEGREGDLHRDHPRHRVAKQVATETGVKVYDGKLYGDAIGDPAVTRHPGGAIVHTGSSWPRLQGLIDERRRAGAPAPVLASEESKRKPLRIQASPPVR